MNLTGSILRHSAEMAKSIRATGIVVYLDVFSDRESLSGFLENSSVPVIGAAREEVGLEEPKGIKVIRVPGIRLTRLGQIKIAVLMGISKGYFKKGDRLVCLSGIAGSGMLDTIVIMEVGKEFEMFAATGAGK